MGQYQQWLQYQEFRKQLSSQAEALEEKIIQLQDYLNQFEQQHSTFQLVDNPIIQALAAHLPFQAASPQHAANAAPEEMNLPETCAGETGDTISPALKSWGGLPDFEPYEIEESLRQENQTPELLNHAELALLPEDMLAFFDEHEQTNPQIELPWWLSKITISSQDEQSSRPIDYNTVRTNRLVQRWVERWGRQTTPTLQSTQDMGENTHE